jgi:hypothetical protein
VISSQPNEKRVLMKERRPIGPASCTRSVRLTFSFVKARSGRSKLPTPWFSMRNRFELKAKRSV